MSITDAKPVAAAARKRRRIVPAGLAAVAFFMLLSPLWAPLLMRRMDFFRVRHVEIVGARYVQPRDVLERLRVDTLASVWNPTRPLESRVGEHPLVRAVSVERKLPGTLVVRLTEHAPVALVPTAAGFRAYDDRGVALAIDPASAEVDAPILARPDTALLRLLAAMRIEAPGLYRRLSELRPDGEAGRDLLLVLDALPVRAPSDVTLRRLADLELVEHDLARRGLRVAELDLRFRDQVIARLQ